MVRRKQASSHIPEGKGRQNSKRKEVLRESAGHQQSPEPYLLSLRSSRVQRPSRGCSLAGLGQADAKASTPRIPLSMRSPASKGTRVSSAQSQGPSSKHSG